MVVSYIRQFPNIESLADFRCFIQSDESKFSVSKNAPMRLLGYWQTSGFVPTSELANAELFFSSRVAGNKGHWKISSNRDGAAIAQIYGIGKCIREN